MYLFFFSLLACNPGPTEETAAPVTDLDGDGQDSLADGGADCDDTNAAIFPGADELCDGVDNNCDGVIDEDSAVDAATWYKDADGDTFGNSGAPVIACERPLGTVSNGDDCSDMDAASSPDGVELCDGLDNDCDGEIDEGDLLADRIWYEDSDGDGWGQETSTQQSCSQPAHYVPGKGDCDDANFFVNPDAIEGCNGIDDNCDGWTDGSDSWDAQLFYEDTDGDGYGVSARQEWACTAPSNYASQAGDCDDLDPGLNPSAIEYCNNIDDNCDLLVDNQCIPFENRLCTDAGWCWLAPSEHGVSLRDVFEFSDGAQVAVGDGGLVMTQENGQWLTVRFNAGEDLKAVWGVSSDDWWAVGDKGAAIHAVQGVFQSVNIGTTDDLQDITGVSAAELYATSTNVLKRYDGASWTTMSTGQSTKGGTAVWASPGHLFLSGPRGDVLYYDGSSWTTVYGSSSGTKRVHGVAGEFYMTASSGTIYHFNGSGFDRAYSTGEGLIDLDVRGPNDVRVLGQSKLYHFDGSNWTTESTGEFWPFYSFTGHTFVGWNGAIATLNTGALDMQQGELRPAYRDLSLITGEAGDDLWVASGGRWVSHWDGQAFGPAEDLSFGGVATPRTGLWAHDGAVYASSVVNFMKRVNGQWTFLERDTSYDFSGLWGIDHNHIWLTSRTNVYFWDGQRVSLAYAGQDKLKGLFGLDASHIWAFGEYGSVLFFDGTSWTQVARTGNWGDKFIQGWASGPDDLWIGASQSGLFHWDGVSLTSVPSISRGVHQIWGRGPDDIYVIGRGLTTRHSDVFHWDGQRWSNEDSTGLAKWTGLYGVGGKVYLAGGANFIEKAQ